MKFPRKGALLKTGPVDWIERYDKPGIGLVLRRRLAWVSRRLPAQCERVLEIGYGSGVLQYELVTRAKLSVGVDIHPHGAMVRARLRADGLSVQLVRGNGTTLPFASGTFDAVVLVSALEFIPEPALCLRECRRVVRPSGRVVCLIPRELAWADAIFRWLTGHDPEADFHGARHKVQAALATAAPDSVRLRRPRWLPPGLAPYELVIVEVPPTG